MVKSLRFLVILIAVAVFSIASMTQSSWATADTGIFTLLPTTGNKCDTSDTVYVAKQYLPAAGFVATSGGVFDNYTGGTDNIIAELKKLNWNTAGTDNNTDVRLTFILKNGTFSKSSLTLLVDNGTSGTVPFTSTVTSPNKVVFTLDNTTFTNDNITATSFTLVDGDDNTILSIKIDGSLTPGQSVGLSLTTEKSTDGTAYTTFLNSCYDKVLYIVENQWRAQLCACALCDNSGVDTDTLVPTDNGVTIEDAQLGVSGVSYYDACYSATTTSTCCPTIDSSCTLFCNESSTTSTCSMPGTCYEKDCGTEYKGLKIYENKDLKYSPYKVGPADVNGANIAFTLTGTSLKNIASIELTRSDIPKFTAIGSFTIDNDTTATASIPALTLFSSVNGGQGAGANVPIYFSVKITPKADVSLDPNSFNLSAVISGGNLENSASLNWGNFLNWTYGTGSYIFKAPYIRQDSAVTSVIRLENAGTTDVGVSLFVNNPDGSGWTFVKHITVAAGTSTVVLGSDLISDASAAGITLDGTKGFAVKGVADATEGKFTVYGSQQMVGAGFRPLPIKVFHGGFYSE